jgi:alpha-beta hydrolase superfamily lysophospholipase
MADQVKQQIKEYDPHRPYVNIHFQDMEMDFVLEWLLGSTIFGGCEIGEAFYTVGNIEDGNPQSWQERWAWMASQVEVRAESALAAGHKVSARESYLKASNYYRTAVVSVLPENSNFKIWGEKSRSTFRQACKLFDPPIEAFEIPFEDTTLPGYFQKVDDSGKKRKTLIMIGGVETFVEELYFYIAPAAIKRGYNFLSADIPGQGMLPMEGKFFRSDSEVPMKAILDYALAQAEIDPQRLAMYGISGGGYFVPRTAAVDKRIKACVINSAVTDMHKQFANMPNTTATAGELEKWSAFKRGTAGVVSWRFGLDSSDIGGLAEKAEDFQFDPAQVTCPALILVGEGEYANREVRNQAETCLQQLPNTQKKFVMTRIDEGASSHCIGGNRSLMSEVVFDWLDEVLPS